jgi:hypothetical protein
VNGSVIGHFVLECVEVVNTITVNLMLNSFIGDHFYFDATSAVSFERGGDMRKGTRQSQIMWNTTEVERYETPELKGLFQQIRFA